MDHIGEWHYFNPADRRTYPKVYSPIEVRHANGSTAEGDFLKLVSETRQRLTPTITNWRYVRDKGIDAASAKSPKAVKVREISDADLENFKRQFGILMPFSGL